MARAGDVLRAGDIHERSAFAAWTDKPLANGEFIARVVRIGGLNVPDAAVLTLDGVVTDYRTVSSFRVGGLRSTPPVRSSSVERQVICATGESCVPAAPSMPASCAQHALSSSRRRHRSSN